MTATAIMPTTATTTDVEPLPQSVSAKPTRHQLRETAIVKIMEEAHCTRDEAVAGLGFILDMADRARNGTRIYDEPGIHHVSSREMQLPGYIIMDAIMAHGALSQEGSAHAAVENVALKPEIGEYALIHDNPTGKRTDCMVAVRVERP